MSMNTFEAEGYHDGFSKNKPAFALPWSASDDQYLRGYKSGSEDRGLCDGIEATVKTLLDGECITQFADLHSFNAWLDLSLSYEEMNVAGAFSDDRSKDMMAAVYENMVIDASQAAAMKKTIGPQQG